MSKKWTRRSALGLIGSGAGLLTWGTGGFTEVQGNRDVSLGTRPDPNGLVGYDDDGSVSGCTGERIDLFDLTNNFGDSMSVDSVTITSASGDLTAGDLSNIAYQSSIGSTATDTVTGEISGNANVGSGQISFEIDVSQNDVSTTLNRTVDLTVKTEETKPFTAAGPQTWNVPSDVAKVNALVVGGGGGGAAHTGYTSAGGGGGGAGGVVFAADYAVPEGGSVSLTVGDGGAGRDQSAPVTGENGESSTFDQLDADGGGGGNLTGGSGNQSANDGGSGGGGRENPPGAATQPGTNASVNRAVDFGNNGARNSTDNGGGGGGGAGEEPADISGNDGGAGGDGVAEAIINGETYVFADIFGTQYGGNGASDRDSEVAEDGIQNTGGGGGGGASGPSGELGGNGGSGIVLLNYCTSNPPPASDGVISTLSDWREGSFNGASASRDDDSGILGIGYVSGEGNVASEIPSGNIVGQWRFDIDHGSNSSGDTVRDYSGQGNPGTTVNGLTTGQAGVFGTKAFEFDGSNYVEWSGAPSFDGVSAFTFAAWVKSDATNVDGAIFGTKTDLSTDGNLGIRYDQNGAFEGGTEGLKFAVETQNGFVNGETESNLQTTDWQHVVLRWESGSAPEVFIDAEPVTYRASPSALSGDLNTPDFYVGRGLKDTAGFWDGLIDEVCVFDKRLTDTEVEALYFNGTNGTFDGSTTSRTVTDSGVLTWTDVIINASVPNNTAADLTVEALDGSGTPVDSRTIVLGNDNDRTVSLSSLTASEQAQMIVSGTTTDPTATWTVDDLELRYEE